MLQRQRLPTINKHLVACLKFQKIQNLLKICNGNSGKMTDGKTDKFRCSMVKPLNSNVNIEMDNTSSIFKYSKRLNFARTNFSM